MSVGKARQGYKSLLLNRHSVIKADDYPVDWNFLALGDPNSGFFSNGVNKNKEDYGHGCLFVNISDVFREFTIDPKKLKRVEVSKEETKRYGLEKGDLILDRSSNIFETVGYPAYFASSNEPVVFSGFTFRYRPNPKIWNSKFLTYQLMSYPIRKLVTSISTRSANSNVNQNSYKKILIPVPLITEQQKIASILSNVDAQIQQTQKLVDLTQRLKKGLMQKLLTKGIGHTKFKKVPWLFGKEIEIPEEWEVIKLKSVSKLQGGYAFKSQDYEEQGIQLLKISNVSHEKFDWDEKSFVPKEYWKKYRDFQINIGDIIIAMTRPIISGGLKVAIFDESKKILLNQRVGRFILERIDSNYFFYIINQKIVINQITTRIGESGQPNISSDEIGEIKIIYSSNISEQQKIVSILSNVDEQINQHKNEKVLLERLKKGLMQQLLTGQRRVIL